MSMELRAEAIESGLIDEAAHVQLLADIDGYTRTAGIQPQYVWTSVTNYCGEDEVAYVETIKDSLVKHEGSELGMLYVGDIEGASINERMMSIAGVCLRNYINAKVMTVQDVLIAMKTDTLPSNVSVLLIPNFFSSRKDGGRIAEWEVANLLGMLYKRQQEGKHTILHVSNMKELKAEYGTALNNHLRGKFVVIKN